MAKREVNHTRKEMLQTRKQRRQEWSVTRIVTRVQGAPSNLESSDEEEEEKGEVTPPPLSLPRETLPPLGDIVSRQVGITVGIWQLKQTWTEIGPLAHLPQKHHLTLVSPNPRGLSVVPVLTEPTHLLRISKVPSCMSIGTITMAMAAGPSSSGPRGTEPPPKKAHFGAFVQVSSRYVLSHLCLMWLLLLLFSSLNSKGCFWVGQLQAW
jgi:hypothetical protein